jgi:zinc protease
VIDRFAGCHFPEERCTLPNGLRVIAVRRDHLPILSATVLLPAGTAMEAPGEAGLSAMAASLLTRGTLRRGAMEIAEAADGIGAGLGVSSDYDYTLAGTGCLSRDAGEALALLAEVLLIPSFPDEEVERRRGEILGLLERRRDDPSDLVRNRFLERIYGAHPYHHPREGLPGTLARFTRGDLAGFYRRHYRPEGAVLALVGDLDPGDAFRLADDLFGGWGKADAASTATVAGTAGAPPVGSRGDSAGDSPGVAPGIALDIALDTAHDVAPGAAPGGVPWSSRAGIPPVRGEGHASFDRLQKDGLTQAVIRLGCPGIRRDAPEYLAAVVMNYLLGGSGAGSRLYRALREDRGLAYEVFSNVHPRRERGYFFASCRTAVETADEALRVVEGELRRLCDEGAAPAEVDLARRFFTGSLPLGLETNDQLATNALAREFYGLDEEFWLRDIERLEAITVTEVDEAARRIIQTDRLAVVVAGDFRGAASCGSVAASG